MADITPTPTVVEADPARPYKAYVAAAVTLISFVVLAWLFDDTPRRAPEFTMTEFKEALLQGLLASGLVGVPTYMKSNPAKGGKRRRR